MYKLKIILVLSILLSSCSKILVSNRNVVRDIKGYLVFVDKNDVIFYPFNDTIDNNFLSSKIKAIGFKIEYDTYWLDSLSIDYSPLRQEISDKKSNFSIIPVEIRYYLGDTWQEKSEINEFHYSWNSQTRTLKFKQYDWRNIISIFLLRNHDQEREALLNIERPPLHYRQFRRDWPGLNY